MVLVDFYGSLEQPVLSVSELQLICLLYCCKTWSKADSNEDPHNEAPAPAGPPVTSKCQTDSSIPGINFSCPFSVAATQAIENEPLRTGKSQEQEEWGGAGVCGTGERKSHPLVWAGMRSSSVAATHSLNTVFIIPNYRLVSTFLRMLNLKK